MRRLIIAFCLWLTLPRLRTNAQHIADLERMLSELVNARDVIADEITETTRRLLAAQEVRDALNKQRGNWMRQAEPIRNYPPVGSRIPVAPPPPPPRRVTPPFVVHSRPAPVIPQPKPEPHC